MDKISIIVPIYNVENELPRCIDSLMCQTYSNLQIILVDDGSPDRCGTICDQYAKSDERIKVIHKKNGGLSDARNAGIEHADGDFLMFIDSDDYIDPDMAEKLYGALREVDANLSLCGFQYDCSAVPDLAAQYSNDLPVTNCVLSGREILTEAMFAPQGVVYSIVVNKLYKKGLFDQVRFPVGKLHEDEFVFHEIMLQCERVACIHDALYHYAVRPGSIMRSSFSMHSLDAAEAMLIRAKDFIRLQFPVKVIYETIASGLKTLNRYYKSSGQKDKKIKQHFRELLRAYRKIIASFFFNFSIPLGMRGYLIFKYLFPYWSFRLLHF